VQEGGAPERTAADPSGPPEADSSGWQLCRRGAKSGHPKKGGTTKRHGGIPRAQEGYSGANVAPDTALGMTAWVAGKALRSHEWLCDAKARTHP
jgi:hypothetical protein